MGGSRLPIPFNNPATYVGHSGVDYAQARGTTFRASGPGRVVSRGRNSRGGFYIWVQYDAGPLVGYHHMDSHAGCPALGARVVEGTPLGHVGNTGNSTGPHLHSEVSGHATTAGYWRFFDPTRVVGSGSASGGGTNPTPSKPNPDPAPVPEEEDEEMKPFLIWKRNSNGTRQWALISGDLSRMVPIWKLDTANALGALYGAATEVVQNEWDGFVRASEIEVVLTSATEPLG